MMKEVVEERANARHCGWPHCCKRIPIPSSDPDAATKVIGTSETAFEEVGRGSMGSATS